jgi:hypothetical protein
LGPRGGRPPTEDEPAAASRPRPAGYARAEARNAEIRARLRPLERGERPLALKLAAGLAALIALANLALLAGGWDLGGAAPSAGGAAVFIAVMTAAAVGLWQRRYWAVLGFEALVGVTVVWASLSLLVAGNLAAVAVCVAIIGLGGWLFWKLVRVMSRIQVPRPGDGRRPGIG